VAGLEYEETEDYSGEYEQYYDDYADANTQESTPGFTWVNGVGILVGVAGALFGVPIFF
jgi:hypothetical protein